MKLLRPGQNLEFKRQHYCTFQTLRVTYKKGHFTGQGKTIQLQDDQRFLAVHGTAQNIGTKSPRWVKHTSRLGNGHGTIKTNNTKIQPVYFDMQLTCTVITTSKRLYLQSTIQNE